MSDEKTKLGRIKCHFCGHETMYLHKHERTLTVGFACAECDVSGYAKKGTSAQRLLLAALPAAPEPAAVPAPAARPARAAATPKPAPAPAPKSEGFSLEF